MLFPRTKNHNTGVEMITYLEYVISFWAENHNTLVEMMVFHRRCRIQDRQGRLNFGLKSIICASMVKIVTKAGYQKPENLKNNFLYQTKKWQEGSDNWHRIIRKSKITRLDELSGNIFTNWAIQGNDLNYGVDMSRAKSWIY